MGSRGAFPCSRHKAPPGVRPSYVQVARGASAAVVQAQSRFLVTRLFSPGLAAGERRHLSDKRTYRQLAASCLGVIASVYALLAVGSPLDCERKDHSQQTIDCGPRSTLLLPLCPILQLSLLTPRPRRRKRAAADGTCPDLVGERRLCRSHRSRQRPVRAWKFSLVAKLPPPVRAGRLEN
jgi:hypothetical protein